MPDSFDPDAWPHGGSTPPSNNPSSNGQGSKSNDSAGSGSPAGGNDDDFDAFGFNSEPAIPSTSNDPDDDFGSFSYDFDDDPATSQSPSPVATSQRQGNQGGGVDDLYDEDPYATPYGDNNDFDDDDSSGGYDDFDDFDNFDREPEKGGNLKRTIIGVLAVVFLVGALGFGIKSLIGGNDKPVTDGAPETAQNNTPSTTAAPAANNNQPAATPPAAGGDASVPINDVPIDARKTLVNALSGWGEFAVNGDLDEVRPYFVNTSDQFLHFQDESKEIKAKPVSGASFKMVMADDAKVTKTSNGEYKIAGDVTATRTGEDPQKFRWEFTLSRANDKEPWQISQVRQY